MRRTVLVSVGIALLLTLSGCSGPGETPSETTTPGDAETTIATTETTGASDTSLATSDRSTTTADRPPAGTQEVTVSRLENQSQYAEWPDSETVRFGNLTEPRRITFRSAFENRSVVFEPDEDNPFSFYDKDRPKVVRYEGTWYFVRVAIV